MSDDFKPAKTKLKIFSKEAGGPTVEAQYNPRELQVDRTIPWSKPSGTNKTGNAKGTPGQIKLEFTGAEGRSMSVELLFDGVEQKEAGGKKVAQAIADLETLASVRKVDGKKDDERRPFHCIVQWGDRGLPTFKCVIESLQIKYQMFDDSGLPLRATATVKLKEADTVNLAKKEGA